MPTKKCLICLKAKQIDEISLCCSACEEKELDLLMAVYAYIHCDDSDYCLPNKIIKGVDSVNGVNVTETYLRSWVAKQWLEKNELNALRVPETIQEAIDEEGFHAGAFMQNVLQRQKDRKPKYDPEILKDFREKVSDDDDSQRGPGMAFMDKKRT